MVNKCVAYGCKTGYESRGKNKQSIASFRFPLYKADLLVQWTRYVNRPDWAHKFIIRRKRNKLRWGLNPVPTIHSDETLKRPSTLPTPVSKRNPPKNRVFQDDQLGVFQENDIKDF